MQHVADANDLDALTAAFEAFKAETGKPTMIIVDSVIGYGAPTKAGHHSAHGEPLGADEVAGAKRFFGLPDDESFHVPDGVREHFADGQRPARRRSCAMRGTSCSPRYRAEYPDLADQLDQMQRRQLPDDWDADLPGLPGRPEGPGRPRHQRQGAERDRAAGAVADRRLRRPGPVQQVRASPSTAPATSPPTNRAGRNLHFGVREHAAGAIANGLALSKIRAYQAGFLIFSDFQRGALRLSALMELPVIHLYTHDSIGVGEDGPTHQPIEQIASLRAMPGLIDLRPGDANEVVEAWRVIMPLRHDPVALILSRQAMPTLDRDEYAPASGLARGAYVLAGDPDTTPEVILIASGTEVGLAVAAYEQLTADGVNARVVSMPSMELFDRQTPDVPRDRPAAAGHRPGGHRARLRVRSRPLGRHHRRTSSPCAPSAPPPPSKPSRTSSGSPPKPSSTQPSANSAADTTSSRRQRACASTSAATMPGSSSSSTSSRS